MRPVEKHSRTIIKICGVRSVAQAKAILDLNADAVGVVIASGSPRQVDADLANAIGRACAAKGVLVMREMTAETLALLRNWQGPVQIHGASADPHRRYIFAGAVDESQPPAHWIGKPIARLFDAPAAGSGKSWDWNIARKHAEALPANMPLLVAGGLHAGNVADAINALLPWAVDVSSGVERDRGMKDLELVRQFIAAVRSCDAAAGRTLEANPDGFEALR